MPVGLPEFVENPENRCPVILLLDTSGSMSGQPIQELNRGLWLYEPNNLIQPVANTIPLNIVHPEIQQCFLKCFNNWSLD